MKTDFSTAPLASGLRGADGGTVEKSQRAPYTKKLTLPTSDFSGSQNLLCNTIEQSAHPSIRTAEASPNTHSRHQTPVLAVEWIAPDVAAQAPIATRTEKRRVGKTW